MPTTHTHACMHARTHAHAHARTHTPHTPHTHAPTPPPPPPPTHTRTHTHLLKEGAHIADHTHGTLLLQFTLVLPTEHVVSQDWCVGERLKDGVHEAGVAKVEQSLETWHERMEALHLTTHIAPEHSKCLPMAATTTSSTPTRTAVELIPLQCATNSISLVCRTDLWSSWTPAFVAWGFLGGVLTRSGSAPKYGSETGHS